ncbi:SHOCT domain-containing protein [Sinorhizobium numidicum]
MLVVGKQRSLSGMSGLILAGMLAGCSSTADLATYPSVYGQKPAATQQMSNEEAVNMQERLTALSAQRRSGAISEEEYQRRLKELQLLAEQHGADALKQIEN